MATKLQALRRGLVQARQYRRMRCGAISIQAAWRCAAARRVFLRHRAAAICIQAHWRGVTALRAYQAAKVGGLAFQAGWRHHDIVHTDASNPLLTLSALLELPYNFPIWPVSESDISKAVPASTQAISTVVEGESRTSTMSNRCAVCKAVV